MDAVSPVAAASAFGIVWAFHFPERGAPSPVMPQNLADALASQSGWSWVHLKLGDVRCRAWIAENAGIGDRAK